MSEEEALEGRTPDLGGEAPPAREGFEDLTPQEQFKKFLGLIDIGPHEPVYVSLRREGKHWTHLLGARKGASADVNIKDALTYNNHVHTNKNWPSLQSIANQDINLPEGDRREIFLRTSEFDSQGIGIANVRRRRCYFAEADGASGGRCEQLAAITQLESRGLRINAIVDSGRKSIHIYINRPRSWDTTEEQDKWIEMALAVLLQGDTSVIAANQISRAPGFARPFGQPQRLIGGGEAIHDSYDELRRVLADALAQVGVANVEDSFAELKRCRVRRKIADTKQRGKNSELAKDWDAHEWSADQKIVAQQLEAEITTDQLLDLVPRSCKDLINNGSTQGQRNDDGLFLTMQLRGTVNVLQDLGLMVETQVNEILQRFIKNSGNDVDEERLYYQYEGAGDDAMPGRPRVDFLSSLHYITNGRLGKRKPKQLPNSNDSALHQLLEAIGPGEWLQNADGPPVRPPQLWVGDFAGLVQGRLGADLRFNDLTDQVEFRCVTLRPEEVEHLYVDLNYQDRYVTQKTAVDVIVRESRRYRYDPVEDYLLYVERSKYIEPVDLGTLATVYLGTSDPLYDHMMRVMAISAVERRLNPGCKCDTVVVPKGAQGIRKSTFWQILASPDWCTSSVPDSDKDLLMILHSTWFYELAEFESTRDRRSAGKLKNLITTPADMMRVPYGKSAERRPRSSIFVGSVNGDSFLGDDTGERRFLVIECPHDPAKNEFIDLESTLRDRDGIWKAAVQAYRAGERPYLDTNSQSESNQRNIRYQVEHPWGYLLDQWLNPKTEYLARYADAAAEDGWKHAAPAQFTTEQAILGCNAREVSHLQGGDSIHMAKLLKARGFVKSQTTVNNVRGYYWSKPQNQSPV